MMNLPNKILDLPGQVKRYIRECRRTALELAEHGEECGDYQALAQAEILTEVADDLQSMLRSTHND